MRLGVSDMPAFQTVRGMRDLIGEEAQTFTYIIANARKTAELYGFKEVITPHVEPLELLSAKSGEEIRQRMFIFKDLGERQVALRPEFTASIARLTTTALRNEPKPLRLFSVGTVYRYDEPQKGGTASFGNQTLKSWVPQNRKQTQKSCYSPTISWRLWGCRVTLSKSAT